MPIMDLPRTRLVVLTDMTSVTAGELEPDDGQSLIRLLLYANHFDIEALIAGSNLEHGDRCRPDIIHRIVDAYGACHANLVRHDANYPPAERLHAVTHGGWPRAGRKIPVEQSIGAGKDTDASRALVAVIDRDDPRPVAIVVWGGTADLAQALWSVKASRSVAELGKFVGKIRVHAIADQDTTAVWLRETFPALYYITRLWAFRGMYRGGDRTLCSSAWIQAHLRGHGALGDLYPDYNGGDIWSGKLGRVEGLKDGDTPSYLSLIPNGFGDPAHPEWGGWGGPLQAEEPPAGGNLRQPAHRFVDRIDPRAGYEADPVPTMAGVYRWRGAFQADFAMRMDRCVKAPGEVATYPVVELDCGPQLALASGQTYAISAAKSRDPAGTALQFQWCWYPTPAADAVTPMIDDARSAEIRITAPKVAAPAEFHLLLELTNGGTPALRAYRRVVVTVRP